MKVISSQVLMAFVALVQLASALPYAQPGAVMEDECSVEVVTVVVTMPAEPASTRLHLEHHRTGVHHHRTMTQSSSEAVAYSPAPSSVAASSVETSSAVAAATTSVENTTPANTFSSSESTSTVLIPSSSSAAAEATSTTDAPSSSASISKPSPTYVSTNTGGGNPFTANGIKAGLSGFGNIATTYEDGFNALAEYIGWYSDYTPTTPDVGNVTGIPMLWGDGATCTSDTNNAQRLTEFKTAVATTTPKLMFGFYEPDCDCPMSSNIQDPRTGAAQWNELIAPLAASGAKLGSPSMCKQTDEDWLAPFKEAGIDADWDITSIHINRNTLEGVMDDVSYYVSTYGKPIWVSEFACVSPTPTWEPCTDQGEIDNFIYSAVKYLQANESVIAYGPSNGEGLGDVWPLFANGELSATGQTYLNALKGL